MGGYIKQIIERSSRREVWRVEASDHGGSGFRVHAADLGVIADGLTREKAEQISASFNAAREDAAALAHATDA